MAAGRPYDLNPHELSDRPEEAHGMVMLKLLLQEHAAAQRSLLACDTAGRLMSALLVIYLGLVRGLTTPQLVSGLLTAALVALFWQWGRRRAGRRIRGVEETLSRMTGGFGERAYIESRFIAESRQSSEVLSRIEPGIWFYASAVVILVSVFVSGID